MGSDWEVTRPYQSTFLDLKEYIEQERGICRHRIQLRLKGKVLIVNREKWTLRRMGVNFGMVVQVEPTLYGSWWWNHYDYYRDLLLQEVEEVLDRQGGAFLHDLLLLVKPPPPITTSLRVFLRTFPERIHMYTNTVDNTIWIERAVGLVQPPTFAPLPHSLGYFPHFSGPPPSMDDEEDYAEEDILNAPEDEVKADDQVPPTEAVDGPPPEEGQQQPPIAEEKRPEDMTPEELELHVAMHGDILS